MLLVLHLKETNFVFGVSMFFSTDRNTNHIIKYKALVIIISFYLSAFHEPVLSHFYSNKGVLLR